MTPVSHSLNDAPKAEGDASARWSTCDHSAQAAADTYGCMCANKGPNLAAAVFDEAGEELRQRSRFEQVSAQPHRSTDLRQRAEAGTTGDLQIAGKRHREAPSELVSA